ncbi:MAG: hypothetical protein V4710_04295 [Verrucomicrobiota bacterium]
MRITLLIVYLFISAQTRAADKLLFEKRDKVEALLGAPVHQVERARASLPTMDVQRFSKDGREYVIYFEADRADRVIVSKQDGTTFTDHEIAELLLSNKSFNDWSQWKLPNRRAWVSGGKIGPFYALVSSSGRSLELITDGYLRDLATHVWLDSTEPEAERP